MRPTRRRVLTAGVCALAVEPFARLAADSGTTIRAVSEDSGATVMFDPVGLRVPPGVTVRWRIVGGVHTVTACHPANGDFPRRMPSAAEPWESGYLQPGGAFEVRLTVPGVYDYLCRPHLAAGMVGRLVVGEGVEPPAYPAGALPSAAVDGFPEVEAIA